MDTKIGRDRKALLESKNKKEKDNDATIQGEITGAIYRNGPIQSRQCTDGFFCGLYVVFLCILLSMTVYAAVEGDIKSLYSGYDTDGNFQDNIFSTIN